MICTEAIPPSNRTNLEHLKDVPIPALVDFGGITFIDSKDREFHATTWRQFTKFSRKRYTLKTNADEHMSDWFWATRGHIPFLEKAVPATNSFVRDLKPGKELVSLFPLTIAPLLGEESNDVDRAAKQHKNWLQFYPQTQIIKQTSNEMKLKIGSYRMSVTILAFGDFNHDGMDDMLIAYDQGVTDGTFTFSRTSVLTRTTPNGPLVEIGPDYLE